MGNAKRNRALDSGFRVGHIIGLLERAMFKQITDALSALEMTFQQFIALMIIAGRGPISNADLARISQMTPQSANQVVKLLESKKWIAREQHPEHQRIVLLDITQRGEKSLQAADAAVMAVEKRMLNGFSTSEKKQFKESLEKCMAALTDLIQPL